MTPFYKHNDITLFCGECEDILPRLPVGVVITDPPYNVGYRYDGYKDDQPEDDYYNLMADMCRTPCVIIHYPEEMYRIAYTKGQFPEKVATWVYNANTPRQSRSVAWFGIKPDFSQDGQPFKNPDDRRIAAKIAQGKEARLYDWWHIEQVKNVSEEKTNHPCQIPLALMERIVKITPAEMIIDPFAGSGTTLLAAQRAGVPAIGIEQSEVYCREIIKRLSQQSLIF